MGRKLSKSTMKVTTCNLPLRHRKIIELFLSMDLYQSRSGFIRDAINEKIQREIASIHIQEMIMNVLEKKLLCRVAREVKQGIPLEVAQRQTTILWDTMEDLRKAFPHLPDYKFINEQLEVD